MAIILLFRKPSFNEYGGWPTVIALIYAGFSAFSALWGEPKDFGFFVLQWCLLATWLCGSCLVFSKREINVEKYLRWFVVLGVLITATTILHYYYFIYGVTTFEKRLWGWNVFRNANEIGAMCGIIALLALTIAMQSLSLKRTWIFYFFALIASLGLVASFSRGALLAFVIMAVVSLALIRPPLKVWLPPIFIVTIALLIILAMGDIQIYYTKSRGDVFGDRLLIWREVFDQYCKNIFAGIGMAKDTNILIPHFDLVNHAHNAWLDTLYRTGLIGLVLVLAHLTKVIQKFSYDPRTLPLYLWLGYGCICNLVDGRCFFWEIGAKWFLYWIPIGLIVAIQTGVIHIQKTKNLSSAYHITN